ncbi:MAG: hypothetical protein U5R30_08335 [Deltaproteobacteria bacterium]|nr:hypothetical protein [Deltaproteobacteria bacterium]
MLQFAIQGENQVNAAYAHRSDYATVNFGYKQLQQGKAILVSKHWRKKSTPSILKTKEAEHEDSEMAAFNEQDSAPFNQLSRNLKNNILPLKRISGVTFEAYWDHI